MYARYAIITKPIGSAVPLNICKIQEPDVNIAKGVSYL